MSQMSGCIQTEFILTDGSYSPPTEPEELTSARKYYMKTKDAEGTLRKLPGGRPLERALLRGLAKREGLNDYLGALKCVSPYQISC